MNTDQFTYWLQGFVEMNEGSEPTKQQWQIIKDHLKLCFNKVTPAYFQPLAKVIGTGGLGSGITFCDIGSVVGRDSLLINAETTLQTNKDG